MRLFYILLLAGSLFGEDVMVERMQSVVDEVTELRSRYESSAKKYETCRQELQERNAIIEKTSRNEGFGYKEFEENRRRLSLLETENKALQKRINERNSDKSSVKENLALRKELDILQKENARINTSATILAEENHSLLEQVSEFKRNETEQADSDMFKLRKEIKASEEKSREFEETIENLRAEIEKTKSNDTKMQKHSADLSQASVVAALKNEMSALKKKLLATEEKRKSLENVCKPRRAANNKKTTKTSKTKTVCMDDNPFPKLMMKDPEKTQPKTPKKKTLDKVKEVPNKIEGTSPTAFAGQIVRHEGRTYRMRCESLIYDAAKTEVIAVWEEKTSFTSNMYKGDWIKITGYFVDRKWQRSTQELWVKAEDTIKR